ncbi:MAG: dihydroxyacetone kinase subunit L [Clostridiaceae bacterium]|jgi:dihydroxyacetone kinase-like protein|nr:dihydroxyacetone kinase subunit L [Clostridiaceae bacterium]
MNSTDLKGIFEVIATKMKNNRDWLVELDSRIGDSDIGFTAAKGFREAYRAIKNSKESNLAQLLLIVGKKMSLSVPSTIGTLLACGFMNAGRKMNGLSEWTTLDFAKFLILFYEGIQTLGNANLNEKTILDSLHPLCQEFTAAAEAGDDFKVASKRAALAGRIGFDRTRDMIARHGKASVYGNKTLSFEDPGAAVAMLMGESIYEYFNNT